MNLQDETSFRCIFGFYGNPAGSKTIDALAGLTLEFMKQQDLLAIWSIEPNNERRITHVLANVRDLQGPELTYESGNFFAPIYRGNERLFQTIEYIFTQIVDLRRYPEFTSLKMPNESSKDTQ
jgi:hypothetical protein